MLITKEVELKIDGKVVNWYKSKGYDCKSGDKITVKVEDLTNKSAIKVIYECDCCKEIKDTRYATFTKYHNINEKTLCVKCANKVNFDKRANILNEYLAHDGYKKCNECKRILPADTDHFFLKFDTKDGFLQKCKECKGKKFTEYLTKIPKEGYKFCIKCDKELPATNLYFPNDKTCKDGIRNICRCCDKSYGNYLSDSYTPIEKWSDYEIDLLKSTYKDYTNEELVNQFFPNRTKHSLESRASIYGFALKTEETKNRANKQRSIKCSIKLKGKKMSDSQKKRISEIKKEYYKTHEGWMYGKKLSPQHCKKISERNTKLGKWKGENNPRYQNPLSGELNGNWKGGITNLYQELRSDSKEWQEKSMEFCNYRCVITNGWLDNVHHLIPFRDIVNETFQILDIDVRRKVLDYSREEWLSISEKLKELHNKYGYGVALCKPIHKLFHDNYGYTNNTSYQFLDFVYRLDIGEFDDWLIENNLSLNINYKFIEELESSLLLQQTA